MRERQLDPASARACQRLPSGSDISAPSSAIAGEGGSPLSGAQSHTFDTLGSAQMTWTDMRRDLSVPALGRTGKAEDDMYAQR